MENDHIKDWYDPALRTSPISTPPTLPLPVVPNSEAQAESPSHGDSNHKICDQLGSTPRDREAVKLSIDTGKANHEEDKVENDHTKNWNDPAHRASVFPDSEARAELSSHGNSNHKIHDQLGSTPQDQEAVKLSIDTGNANHDEDKVENDRIKNWYDLLAALWASSISAAAPTLPLPVVPDSEQPPPWLDPELFASSVPTPSTLSTEFSRSPSASPDNHNEAPPFPSYPPQTWDTYPYLGSEQLLQPPLPLFKLSATGEPFSAELGDGSRRSHRNHCPPMTKEVIPLTMCRPADTELPEWLVTNYKCLADDGFGIGWSECIDLWVKFKKTKVLSHVIVVSYSIAHCDG